MKPEPGSAYFSSDASPDPMPSPGAPSIGAMTSRPTLPGQVSEAVDVWLSAHDEHAPGLIAGLYIVGSAALDDWRPGSDIDVVAFCSSVPDDGQVAQLRSAHRASVDLIGTEVDVDGPRLTWSDVTKPPAPWPRPWTLAGEFHHDEECFEQNPVTWQSLADHGVSVRGPVPSELSIAVDTADLQAFVAGNTGGYWRSVADAVNNALADPDRTEFNAEMTSWCVLGLARMLCTSRTGTIVSKTSAGRWLAREHPELAPLVEHAVRVRLASGGDPAPPDDRATAIATAQYMRTVIDLVVDGPLTGD